MNFLIDHSKDFHVQLQLQVRSREQILTLGITYTVEQLILREWQCFQLYEIFLWLPRVIPSSRPCWTSRRAEIVWEGITAHVGIMSGSGDQEERHFQGAGTQGSLFKCLPAPCEGGAAVTEQAQKDRWAAWTHPAPRGSTEMWLVLSSERLGAPLPLCPVSRASPAGGFVATYWTYQWSLGLASWSDSTLLWGS